MACCFLCAHYLKKANPIKFNDKSYRYVYRPAIRSFGEFDAILHSRDIDSRRDRDGIRVLYFKRLLSTLVMHPSSDSILLGLRRSCLFIAENVGAQVLFCRSR